MCYRMSMAGKNIRTEPKHITFLLQLLLLLQFCHACKADNPAVETYETGTSVAIKTCHNANCKEESTWHSQPCIPGSCMPAGNFLLCLSILLSGGSLTKVKNMFTHMGFGCISLNTFFKWQRVGMLYLSLILQSLKYANT